MGGLQELAQLPKLGGKKGGKARAEKLTPERRKEIARKAAKALCKVLAHNICVLIHAMHALNVHPVFRGAQMGAARV